jgi:hypothetical protein
MHMLPKWALPIAVVFAVILPLHADARPTYPDPVRPDFRDEASLTAADWVGPDGIVYPRWDRAGVVGGIPSADWPVVASVVAEPRGRDITADLQAAVDEAGRRVREEGLDGGVVRIPSGTYRLTAPIAITHDRVAIRGWGTGEPGRESQVSRLLFELERPADGKPWTHVVRYGGVATQHSVITVFADPRYEYRTPNHQVDPYNTIERIGVRIFDESGGLLGERDSNMPGGQGPAFYQSFVLDQFPRVAQHQRVLVEPWVRYRDGEELRGERREVSDIEYEREALPGVRRPNRYIRSAAISAFIVLGDQWTHRNNDQHLARPALRGDDVLVFENDVSLEENGGLQRGDLLRLEAQNTPWLREKTGGGHPRMQNVTIAAVDGNRVTIDQPLRITFPVTEGETDRVSFAKPRYPIDYVGLEDFVLQFPNRWDWLSTVEAQAARNFWMRGVRVVDAGRHPAFLVGVKHAEIRDCQFIGAHWPNAGGASAYVGFAGCDDSLMENIVGVGLRHAPDNHGGTGNVVRNSIFSGSDVQWHNGYGVEHLIENVTAGSNTLGGGYYRTVHTPETGNQIHSPPGPRNVLWNNDLFGTRGGVHLGGYQQGWIIAYNRLHNERGPSFLLNDRQTDHLIIGNTIINEDIFAPVIVHGRNEVERFATKNTGIDFIGNRIFGSSGTINAGNPAAGGAKTELRRSFGNVIHGPDHAAPRPDLSQLPIASVFEAQREYPRGMPPESPPGGGLLFNPDPDFRGEPDRYLQPRDAVASVNFTRTQDAEQSPEGWLSETGEAFGPRAGGLRFGWDGAVRAHRFNRPYNAAMPAVYDTSNDFGEGGASRSWSIELPPGDYVVQVGLGASRYPTWRDHDAGRPDTSFPAIHDVWINDQLMIDRDGHTDHIDVHQAQVTVGPGSDNRVTIRPGSRSQMLRVMFVRVYRAAGAGG